MRHRLIALLWAVICLPDVAVATQVWLTAARDSASVARFSQDLASQRPQDQIVFLPLEQLKQQPLAPQDILITLDQPSLQWRASQTQGPSTLAIRASRVLTLDQFGTDALENITLLWDDPAPERQLRLAKLILPATEKVGMLYSEQSAALLNEYEQAAVQQGLALYTQYWIPTSNRRPLVALLQQTDFLLGTNAPQLFNANSIKSLLLTSYEQKRPVIGPSAAFVRAGSLASTYSDQDDWLVELKDWLATPREQWPSSTYPKRYKAIVNRQVARALGLAPLPDSTLTDLLNKGD